MPGHLQAGALTLLLSAVDALSANAWLTHGRARDELKLGVLPFLLEHAMLPGEMRDVFLFDDSLRACVKAASRHGCVGGLMMNDQGGHFELMIILKVHEIKTDSECTWVRLSCTGRCLISSIRKNKRHGYRVAVVSPYGDDNSDIPPTADLCALHAKVALYRRQLQKDLLSSDQFDSGTWELLSRESEGKEALRDRPVGANPHIHVGADKARGPFGIYESYEAFEETGDLCDHVYVGQVWERPTALGCCYFNARDLGELDDEENGAELEDLLARRRAALTGDTSAGLLDAVGGVWEAPSEEHAQIQLVSFAAAATLSPMDRAQALMIKDTSQRLEFAQGELCNQLELLTDLLETPTLQGESEQE